MTAPTRPLRVMVLESRRGAAGPALRDLAAAGHLPLTCHADPEVAPCRGLASPEECPLTHDPDVAVLVRPDIDPHPTAREVGVICAVRAGVPLVEQGPTHLDPYDPWVVARVDGDGADGGRGVTAAAEAGAAAGDDRLRREMRRRVAPVLAAAGVPAVAVGYRVDHGPDRLEVRVDVPEALPAGRREAIAVQVLDAARTAGRRYGCVDVAVVGPDG